MTETSGTTNYEDRLNRVTEYIYAHLDDEIDLQRLADVACLSPYHWHRVYHAVRGETIAATVKRLRLHRAAGFLANSTTPLAEIASKSRYPNLQSFSRTFKTAYGMPPAEYRKNGSHKRFQDAVRQGTSDMYDVTIRTVVTRKTIGINHTGSYMEVGRAFEQLLGWLATRGLLTPDIRMVGIYFSDPSSVPEAELKSRACVYVDQSVDVEPPVVETDIVGGPCAVLRHVGPYANMRSAYDWLYGTWLPESGHEPADAPVFEEYLNNPRDTAPSDLITEIYLPLKAEAMRGAAE